MNKLVKNMCLGLLALLMATLFVTTTWAGCSSYIGRATINEASTKNNEDFVEIKLLDSNITSTVYNNWTIGVCSNGGGCSTYNVSSASVTLPYLLVGGIDPKELDFNKGMDIILLDGNGDAIDYLTAGGYSDQAGQASGCAFDFDTAVAKSNTHTFGRFPDGTGDWAATGPGGSVPNTEEATNDDTTGPDGNPIARIDIGNVTVNRGDSATFTVSVYDENGNPTTKPYSIDIEYETIDDSALAGTDYTATSGTLNIPANAASATFDVPTLGSGGGCGGGGGGVDFWIRILNPNGVAYPVVILNHFAIGSIVDGGTLDHIRIEHSGIGLTCQRSDIVIRACEDASCSSEYLCPVTVTMTPASANPPAWISGDTYTFSTGSTTVQLRQNTPTTLTLGIASPSPTPSNGTTCYLGGSPGSCDMEFFESGFVFDIPDLTSCQTSSAVSIQAVRADATAQTCVADGGFANSGKTVNFWSNYTNPASGSSQVGLSGSNIATSSPGTGISLNFDATATASFTVNYPDAGQLLLDARYDGVGAEETGLVMLGNDSFTVRPVGLCVYSDDINADCASGDGSCSGFKRVNENFNLKIKAVCWESAGDTDFCSGNTTTPNYVQNGIPISHTRVAPTSAGSADGSIGISSIDMVDADNGEHVIGNQTVSEVGVFTFTAAPTNYFGTVLPAATSTNIGRFTPDHFETSISANGTLENACTGFTYSGQGFGYDPLDRPTMTITATDSGGNTTVNYRDDFVKLTDPATQISMPAVTADATSLGADAVTPLALTWSPAASNLTANADGTLTFTLGADQFTYTRNANALVDLFNTDIQLEVASIADGDGITANDLSRFFVPASIEVRYGQLVLRNAYGPETLPLTLPLLAEYFNGTSFVSNSLDNCTAYDSVNLGLSNFQGNLALGETTPAGNGTLLAGVGTGMSLSAPWVSAATPNDGSVDLTLDLSAATGLNLPWLLPGGVNPTAQATFGIFKGNERLIYMRESVQ